MTHILASGAPAPGHEAAYRLAWKHRSGYGALYLKTPCWHIRSRRRRWKAWTRAIGRVHEHGQDVIIMEV